jgi:hypothetical protein
MGSSFGIPMGSSFGIPMGSSFGIPMGSSFGIPMGSSFGIGEMFKLLSKTVTYFFVSDGHRLFGEMFKLLSQTVTDSLVKCSNFCLRRSPTLWYPYGILFFW